MADPEFWHDKWARNELGFHQEEGNPFLREFWSHMEAAPGASVFVPLCGKSRDMVWLREQGLEVWGAEISPIAIRDFYSESHLDPSVRRDGKLELWEGDGFHLWCGDLFDLDRRQLKGLRYLYDRASMIALPPSVRKRYCAHLRAIMPMLRRMLLITLEYEENEMEGPPYSVREQEIFSFFEAPFEVRVLGEEGRLSENTHFQQKGLSKLIEKAYLIST